MFGGTDDRRNGNASARRVLRGEARQDHLEVCVKGQLAVVDTEISSKTSRRSSTSDEKKPR